MARRHQHHASAAVAIAAIAAISQSWVCAAPTIRNLNLRALQSGASTTLVIDGSDLLPNPVLVANLPIVKQEVKPDSTATKLTIEVALDANATPGAYNLWLVTGGPAGGASEKQVVMVDALPQRPFAAQVELLPVALHANMPGSGVLETTFTGSKNQQVQVEVETQRLGGKAMPVIHLVDPAGREIGLALPSPLLRNDARLVAALSADGVYKVRVHDLQYAGSGACRIKIGAWANADAVFPPAVQRGRKTSLLLIDDAAARAAKPFDFVGDGAMAFTAAPWLEPAAGSGLRAPVAISDIRELVENGLKLAAPPATSAAGDVPPALLSPRQLPDIELPFAVSGRLIAAGEEDRYQLTVEPEAALRFEVFADRLGSSIDAAIDIRNLKGDRVASNDDAGIAGSADARLDYKAPKDVTALILCIRDVHQRGGPASVYRLLVSPQTETNPRPDFDLIVEEDVVAVPLGAASLMKVSARRRNYDGPIRLRFDRLPAGSQPQPMEIPAGESAVLVRLARQPAPAELLPQVTALIGEGGDASRPLLRAANVEQHPLGDLQPWLRSELVALPAEPNRTGFTADFTAPPPPAPVASAQTAAGQPPAPAPVAAPPADRMVLGLKSVFSVKCIRPVGFDGPVRLTFLTNQATPLNKDGKPDANSALRPEANKIEIPADGKATATFDAKVKAEQALAAAKKAAAEAPQEKKADAEAKEKQAAEALAVAEKAAAEAAASAKNSVDVTLVVPPNLPAKGYELAFRAELLSRDGKSVLATHYTAVKQVPAVNPVAITLNGEPRVEVRLDAKAGATVAWSGTIQRLEGVAGEVTVSLDDSPKGVAAPKVVVPADKSDFKIELKLPANHAAGLTENVKLFATIKPDAKNAGIVVRSADALVSLNVLPAEAEKKEAK